MVQKAVNFDNLPIRESEDSDLRYQAKVMEFLIASGSNVKKSLQELQKLNTSSKRPLVSGYARTPRI